MGHFSIKDVLCHALGGDHVLPVPVFMLLVQIVRFVHLTGQTSFPTLSRFETTSKRL